MLPVMALDHWLQRKPHAEIGELRVSHLLAPAAWENLVLDPPLGLAGGGARFVVLFFRKYRLFIAILLILLLAVSACANGPSGVSVASGQSFRSGQTPGPIQSSSSGQTPGPVQSSSSGQTPGPVQSSSSASSPTAGFTLPGRSSRPLTVTWISSLGVSSPSPTSPPPSSSLSPSSSPAANPPPSKSPQLSTVLPVAQGDSDWYTALVNVQCGSVVAPPDASDSLSKLVRGVQAACDAVTAANTSAAEDWSLASQVYAELAGMPMPCEETVALDLLARLVQAHQEDPEATIQIVSPDPGQQSECS